MAKNDLYLVNRAQNKVKAVIYKYGDSGLVPLQGGVVNVDAPGTRDWTAAKGEEAVSFHVKFFKPAIFDRFLAGADGVAVGSTVTLHEDEAGNFSIEVSTSRAAAA